LSLTSWLSRISAGVSSDAASSKSVWKSDRNVERKPRCALSARRSCSCVNDNWFSISMLWTTQRASSRTLFTKWTDPALITVSTTRPAASSRI